MSEQTGTLERAIKAVKAFTESLQMLQWKAVPSDLIGVKVTDMQYPKSMDEKRLEEAQDRLCQRRVFIDFITGQLSTSYVPPPCEGSPIIGEFYRLRRDAYWRPRFGQAAEFMRIVGGGR